MYSYDGCLFAQRDCNRCNVSLLAGCLVFGCVFLCTRAIFFPVSINIMDHPPANMFFICCWQYFGCGNKCGERGPKSTAQSVLGLCAVFMFCVQKRMANHIMAVIMDIISINSTHVRMSTVFMLTYILFIWMCKCVWYLHMQMNEHSNKYIHYAIQHKSHWVASSEFCMKACDRTNLRMSIFAAVGNSLQMCGGKCVVASSAPVLFGILSIVRTW